MDGRITTKQKIASSIVLFILTLERLAYYGLVLTFYLFLNKGPWNAAQGWDSLDALNAVFVLLGMSYVSALLGGYMSDAWLGRFFTIALGLVLYIIGYILLTLITIDKLPRLICSGAVPVNATSVPISDVPNVPCKAAVYMSIVVVGFGVGLVKANIGPFGAEQLGPSNPSLTRAFFNWYYWCSNVGSLIGIGVLSFIEQDNPGVCTNGFFCGYLIATVALTFALVIFMMCMSLFTRHAASGSSPLLNIFRITWEATRIKFRDLTTEQTEPPPIVQPKFLDLAKVRYGGRFHEAAVDDVRSLGSMIALFASLLPYWLVYFQIQTTFQAQGLHMRFMVGSNNSTNVTEKHEPEDQKDSEFSIPTAWLTLFNQVFLIVCLPLLTNFVYPYLDRRGVRMSMLARIGVGMLISSTAVFFAGGLESFRTMLWNSGNFTHINQTVGNVTYNAVDISIFWQVPQYMLVAAAEALASIAGLEYAYSEAPRSYQSLIMGLFYAMEGIGSFLGVALLQILSPVWFNSKVDFGNINENHLDFYLYFLGIIQIITLLVYTTTIYVARFSLELVPLPCDSGLGRPTDRIRVRPYRRRERRVRYRELNEEDQDGTNGRAGNADQQLDGQRLHQPEADEELINPNVAEGLLPPADESDDSASVKNTPPVTDILNTSEENIPGTPVLNV